MARIKSLPLSRRQTSLDQALSASAKLSHPHEARAAERRGQLPRRAADEAKREDPARLPTQLLRGRRMHVLRVCYAPAPGLAVRPVRVRTRGDAAKASRSAPRVPEGVAPSKLETQIQRAKALEEELRAFKRAVALEAHAGPLVAVPAPVLPRREEGGAAPRSK